ncbi:MAG: pseudouridine synthase [Aeromicrobium sp.]|uniref:pseudouridine synthase n=1 Tax=Aeromicrobium sp. TaxID=1871063 RepID=UPI0039E25E2D
MCTPPARRGVAPEWATMADWLRSRLPSFVDVEAMVADGAFVDASGRAVRADDPYRPGTWLWFHRPMPDEPVVAGEVEVVWRDERIVVVDKPPFLATTPRGSHVRQTAQARLRVALGLPELQPAHRLDRLTSGVLLLTTERRWRGAYQQVFQRREAMKVYRALAPYRDDVPEVVRNHLSKERGVSRTVEVPGELPNAETRIEVERVLGDRAVYRLTPLTGQTHQLRAHLTGLGLPIVGDPLYGAGEPGPLQLLAAELAFPDPVDGTPRRFVSGRSFPIIAPC